ncbi:hypothetical protein PHLGIDRAFT_28714 [Phlebiopsis gigantea 11061_1 CR5-6]|uniref:Symplekin n=1 Tax=Phlebiopsis gigantea (strain 11061_1 CR5-6) TaxID=745531 RepID=A0A0C3NX73_PHLG1|nr:hypothetical protein PHLGIDRAFT_28714 [Phlebiopsis gigantea 11061_1 CR5-6]
MADPLQQLSAALAVPADSKEQADLLAALRESLEARPGPIQVLCTTLVKTVSGAGDSLLKRWVLDLLHFAICRSTLPIETRTLLALNALDTLAGLIHDANVNTVKVAVQCFATVYPLLFRKICTQRNMQLQWDLLTQTKTKILDLVWAPSTPLGIKISSIKFMQRVILVQTRGPSDPRLQKKDDPNLSILPADHPYMSGPALEAEGGKLLEAIITLLYTSPNPDIVSAILNSWSAFVKQRPAFVELVVSTLASWAPNEKLLALPTLSIRSVERSIKILLTHIMRSPQGGAFIHGIQNALAVQAARIDKAVLEEKQRKMERKRPPSVGSITDAPEAKRVKLEPQSSESAAFLASFDFTTLPASLVTDLIVANLAAYSEATFEEMIAAYRQGRPAAGVAANESTPRPASGHSAPSTSVQFAPPDAPAAMRTRPPSSSVTPAPVEDRDLSAPRSMSQSPPGTPPLKAEDEPVDPLKMDIDEEEIEYEPEKLNLEIELEDFKLPAPKELPEEAREALIQGSLSRIWDGAKDLQVSDFSLDYMEGSGTAASDMWMLLIVRLVTRVVDPAVLQKLAKDDAQMEEEDIVSSDIYAQQDRLRQKLCDYIMSDFPSRLRLATTWMNEEWYNDQIRTEEESEWRPNYETWLNQIVAVYQTHLDNKDRTFSHFLLDLPTVPSDIMSLLREMCVEADRRQVGFATLRDFVSQRPSLRAEAITMLLELTTHPDKTTRGAAINTVKRWIPDTEPMASMIREFAMQLLRRLQSRPKPARAEEPRTMGDENMEDDQLPQEDIIQTPYLPEQLELPARKDQVLQHLELVLALSTRVPGFLEGVFAAYGAMEETVQETVQQLITPLIKALGSSHGKLLTLLRTFPPGAEILVLRVLTIFTETSRPSAQLVALVKGLIHDRDLDARFLIPIIAEMDKADILRHLPRIVSILNGKPEPKNLVRSVFSSVVTAPPQGFGSVSSNLPRVRQSELLTPAELMVLLHESEKEIGLKAAIEAIGVCFSMTDIFRSDILAVVMNQLVDEPMLPTLFMRTVIQAVSTYRSLVPFVSSTLLTRLITKKIWTVAPLWEGFIRCAKLIAPASFGALLQLPKEQLRELVDKQPSLKAGLREYVTKKAGNKARVAGLLDIFAEDEGSAPAPKPESRVLSFIYSDTINISNSVSGDNYSKPR